MSIVKVLLVSLVASTPVSYINQSQSSVSSSTSSSINYSSGGHLSGCGSSVCTQGSANINGGSLNFHSLLDSFSSLQSISRIEENKKVELAQFLNQILSRGIVIESEIINACKKFGISFNTIENEIYSLIESDKRQNQNLKVIWGQNLPHQSQVAVVSTGVRSLQAKLIKYQGFSSVPHNLMNQLSSLLYSQIESGHIVYSRILDLCSRYNYDVKVINTGLFKFFKETYSHNIKYDLRAFYINQIKTQGSSIVSRIASQFGGISVTSVQNVMAQYLDYTLQGKTNFNFAKCFKSEGIQIRRESFQSLQAMFVSERQNLIYSAPEINTPSFVFESSQRSSSYSKSKRYSSFQKEFSETSFSSQKDYGHFFSQSRTKYSDCDICIKKIDSLSSQAKYLSKSESNSVSIKQKLEHTIKVESEFSSETGAPDTTVLADKETKDPQDSTDKGTKDTKVTTGPIVKDPKVTTDPIVNDPKVTTDPIVNDPKATTDPIVNDPKVTTDPIVKDSKATTDPIVNDPKVTTDPIVKDSKDVTLPNADKDQHPTALVKDKEESISDNYPLLDPSNNLSDEEKSKNPIKNTLPDSAKNPQSLPDSQIKPTDREVGNSDHDKKSADSIDDYINKPQKEDKPDNTPETGFKQPQPFAPVSPLLKEGDAANLDTSSQIPGSPQLAGLPSTQDKESTYLNDPLKVIPLNPITSETPIRGPETTKPPKKVEPNTEEPDLLDKILDPEHWEKKLDYLFG